jgi:hypothetical protein
MTTPIPAPKPFSLATEPLETLPEMLLSPSSPLAAAAAPASATAATTTTLGSLQGLQTLEQQVSEQLQTLEAALQALEPAVQQYQKLRHERQRLLQLQLTLSTLQSDSGESTSLLDLEDSLPSLAASTLPSAARIQASLSRAKPAAHGRCFYPELALEEAQALLKTRETIYFQLFQAVVLTGGKANTRDLKAYLIEQGLSQPRGGKSFEEVPLTQISAMANYLVRKAVLRRLGNGVFESAVGWG